MSHHLRTDIRPDIIPEFPVRLGTIYPNVSTKQQNRSCKIDYVTFSNDGSKSWFVELKTDALSRRDRQDDYLIRAQQLGMQGLIDGVCKLFLKTESTPKYYHLLGLIESLGILRLPDTFHQRSRTGWTNAQRMSDISKSVLTAGAPDISIIYLQPLQTQAGEIGFDRLADWLDQFDDALSKNFCASLRRWARSPAGIQE